MKKYETPILQITKICKDEIIRTSLTCLENGDGTILNYDELLFN